MELRSVSKRYGETLALDGVSLRVDEGEVLALVGPNGAGKTTLLKIMAAIERPTSGEVYFRGAGAADTNHLRRRSTMVFQRVVLFNGNVYQNVAYGLKMRRYPWGEVERRVGGALELVELGGYQRKPVKRLSGGEQQRVCLARALALDTELLLLDEPMANLDPKSVAIVEGIISRLRRSRGSTVVVATHNLLQAEHLADRAALLTQGRIAEVGSASEVFGEPSWDMKSFARFENVFHGEARDGGAGTSLISLGGGVEVEAVTGKSGGVTLFVRPEEIILSEQPASSSARNVLRGRVVEISDLGSLVRLKVDVGRVFVVKITKKSFGAMRPSIGSEVFLTFKASSVRVL